MSKKKLKVGLIIDEYFGAVGTAYGGYGFLARRIIAKYLADDDIQIDVLLGPGQSKYFPEKSIVDSTSVYRLPRKRFFARYWLKKQNYDVYLSIELTYKYILECDRNAYKKLILWIQDPRPQYEWDEINTVKLFTEYNYYDQSIYDLVNKLHACNRVKFISQAKFLNEKAIDLYQLDKDVEITQVNNPIEIDCNFNLDTYKKKNNIIFLGRLESVKRGWMFCEIAKQLPQYDFYVLGQTFREKKRNAGIIDQYKSIPNLHFVGHVDGDEKLQYLKDAKILVNTSIHEALPISFLEALSFGTLLVSNRNPENLTAKFGIHVGDVLGDGFDKIDLFVSAISKIMEDSDDINQMRHDAIEYIKKNHNLDDFKIIMKNIILDETLRGKIK